MNDIEKIVDEIEDAIDEYIEQSQESKLNEALTSEFSRVTDDMIELYSRKNADYGNSFGRTYQELGIISAVTRMNDKMERLKRLATKPGEQRVTDENIDDTLTDLACYAVMTLMERRREKGSKE